MRYWRLKIAISLYHGLHVVNYVDNQNELTEITTMRTKILIVSI